MVFYGRPRNMCTGTQRSHFWSKDSGLLSERYMEVVLCWQTLRFIQMSGPTVYTVSHQSSECSYPPNQLQNMLLPADKFQPVVWTSFSFDTSSITGAILFNKYFLNINYTYHICSNQIIKRYQICL